MNNLNCKVSIITVSYNSVKTIEQTITSVLSQSYKNIEYIIIDGASKDGTQQVIEKYKDKISYYVSEKDKGLYYAMNKGLDVATGDIIGIINSDDWYTVDAVANVVECFAQNDAELIYGLTVVVEQDGTEKLNRTKMLETIWHQAPFFHPSVFVKKDVYNRIGEFCTDYKVAADYDLLLKFYSENIKFQYIDKVIAYFRLGGISTVLMKTGYRENYKISMSYVDKCPNREYVLEQIKEHYEWACFTTDIEGIKGLFSDLLCEYFQENITEISIFGIGSWGEYCYKILTENKIKILHIIDNDEKKQNKNFHGIKILKPQMLKEINTPVLIAVREKGEKIQRQLEDLNIRKEHCVTITELEAIFLRKQTRTGNNILSE